MTLSKRARSPHLIGRTQSCWHRPWWSGDRDAARWNTGGQTPPSAPQHLNSNKEFTPFHRAINIMQYFRNTHEITHSCSEAIAPINKNNFDLMTLFACNFFSLQGLNHSKLMWVRASRQKTIPEHSKLKLQKTKNACLHLEQIALCRLQILVSTR